MSFPSDLQAFVDKYAPIVYLNPTETHLPDSADWYALHAGYFNSQTNTVLGPGGWTWQTVPLAPGDYLIVDDPQLQAGSLQRATAYVHVQSVDADTVDIQYWLFYAFNGDVTLRLSLDGQTNEALLPYSDHQGDWERIVVRVNSSGSIVQVFYSQHNGGPWLLPGTSDPNAGFPNHGGTHPIAFAALGSHANYPSTPGPFRIGGVSNTLLGHSFEAVLVDYTGQSNNLMVDYSQPGRSVIVANNAPQFNYLPQVPGWLAFEGRWGRPIRFNEQQVVQVLDQLPLVKAAIQESHLPQSAVTWLASTIISVVQDGKGPTNPASQSGWTKGSGTFLAWTKDSSVSGDSHDWSQSFDKVSLVTTSQPAVLSFQVPLPVLSTTVQQAVFSNGKWSGGPSTNIKSSGPPAALNLNTGGGSDSFVLVTVGSGKTLAAYRSPDGRNWSQVQGFPGPSATSGAALVVFNGRSYCGYRGPDGTLRYITTSDWVDFSGETIIPGASIYSKNGGPWWCAPAFAVIGGRLVAVYCGLQAPSEPAPSLNSVFTDDGAAWQGPFDVGDAQSVVTPALASFSPHLLCMYVDAKGDVRYTFSRDGEVWISDASRLPSAVSHTPAAVIDFNGTLLCVHPGASKTNLYYATAPVPPSS